jgi:RNA polymerase sigma-54 factor
MLRSLNVLQLPTEELRQLLTTEIQNNPLLDIATNDVPPHPFACAPTNGKNTNNNNTWNGNDGNNDTDMNRRTSGEHTTNAEESPQQFLENIATEYSPEDYLLAQVPDLDEFTKAALITLINSLDDQGFLPENVAQQFGIPQKNSTQSQISPSDNSQQNVFERAYNILRSLSPKGIGARDLQDCLQLQVPENTPLYDLLTHHFDDLKQRRFTKLQRSIHRTPSQLRTLLSSLKRLNFAPLQAIKGDINPPIMPEIIFQKIDNQWGFEIDTGLAVRLSDLYKRLLIHPLKGEDRKFFTEKKQNAQFWVNALGQRRKVLQKIAAYILQYQVDFLEHGSAYLRPQSQKQSAEILGIHPSRLSRIIYQKHAKTPHGIIPLKSFFTHGNHGSLVAQNALEENIKNIINNECKKTPFSDKKIAKILQDTGIWISRRTVAKYRSLLRIPPANVRKYY